jgi:hypothetical protein
MKLQFLFCTFLIAVATAGAQTRYFDIFTFKKPAGFILTDANQKQVYQKNEGKEYCQLILYPASQGTGNADADFKKAWDFFARRPAEKVNDPETYEKDSSAAWYNCFGAANGIYNNKKYVITVSSFTKGELTFYTAAVFTNQTYIQSVKDFIAGIQPNASKFVKTNNKPASNNNNTTGTNNTTIAANGNSNASNKITKPTITFDDGWTSMAYDDYISITKNNVEARIIFSDPKIDNALPQNTSIFEPYYWDNFVRRYYTVTGQPIEIEKPQYSMGEQNIWLAPATDKATGRQGYVGMIYVSNNGAANVVTVFGPDKQYFSGNFTTSADYRKMFNYNKFYASTQDLIGTWRNSGGSAIEYYNVYTGNSAGMATAHVSDKFTFKNNGTYESEHTGTSTFQGSLSHGVSKYNGNFSISDVNFKVTGRGNDDPGDFYCWFEAVKNGFMLRLINRKFSGQNMLLYRVQ